MKIIERISAHYEDQEVEDLGREPPPHFHRCLRLRGEKHRERTGGAAHRAES